MTATLPSVRETLNNGAINQLADIARQVPLGDMLSRLILLTAADQTALNPTAASPAQQITLALVPSAVLHVLSVAGVGALGRLALLVGPDVDPSPGQVVWNGPGSGVLRFNAADAFTNVSVWYTNANGSDTISAFERRVGQQDA